MSCALNRQLYPGLDPYQDVFNRIANDLAEVKDDLSSAEKRDVRTVAQLRFASELSPEAFGEHVVQEHSGRFVLNRLPAEDDPQIERALSVRDREHLFVETLNEHYVDVYEKSKDSYHGWRETARQEAAAPATEQVVRIRAEAAFEERRRKLGVRFYERPDMNLFRPPTAIVLTGNLTPELSGVEAKSHQESAALRYDIVGESHDADGVAVRRIGPNFVFKCDRHSVP